MFACVGMKSGICKGSYEWAIHRTIDVAQVHLGGAIFKFKVQLGKALPGKLKLDYRVNGHLPLPLHF